MHSSTSSSEGRRWIATWALALLLVVCVMGAWEMFWRGHGFVPILNDDEELWAIARARSNDLGRDAVVLLGSSRMQIDINREAFSAATGWSDPVQLAIVSGPSTPILRGLTRDPEFRGTAICEINPTLFFSSTPRMDREIAVFERVYKEFTFPDRVEQWLRMFLQQHLIVGLPRLTPSFLRTAWTLGRYPLPAFSELSPERFRSADYLRFTNLERGNEVDAELRRSSVPKLLTPELFQKRIGYVKNMARVIGQRGGSVVFVRLPSAIHVRAYEENWFPREKWWDVFAEQVEAPTIHFLDEPTLVGYKPLDGEHIDKRNAVNFSKALGGVLVRRSLAPGPVEKK